MMGMLTAELRLGSSYNHSIFAKQLIMILQLAIMWRLPIKQLISLVYD